MRFLAYLADVASEIQIENPLENLLWNSWMIRILHLGADAGVSKEEAIFLSRVIKLECKPNKDATVFFAELYYKLHKKYNTCGPCSKYLIGCNPYEIYTPPIVAIESGWMCFFRQKKKSIQDLLYGFFGRGGTGGGGGDNGGKGVGTS